MKKIVLCVFALLMALFPFGSASALSLVQGAPTNKSLLNGQKHYYTVQLRSDKKAVVYARIIFENASSDADQSSYRLTLPNDVTVQNFSAQQILVKLSPTASCDTYETLEQWRTRVQKDAVNTQSDTAYNKTRLCLQEAEGARYNEDYDYDANTANRTDYYRYSYYQQPESSFDYVDLKQNSTGNTYNISLDKPVKPKKQGSLLLSFTTNNFVSGGIFGRFDYNVRTLLSEQMIAKTTVAINFDTDLYTREATQQRAYENTPPSLGLNGLDASGAYQSKTTDTLVQGIGRGGLYVKSQSSLLPGDILSVTGVFATNQIVMYTTELLVCIALLGVLAASIVAHHFWRKKHPRAVKVAASETETTALPDVSSMFQRLSATTSGMPWRAILLASVVSIIGTIVLTLAIGGFIESMTSGSSSPSSAPKIMLQIFGIFAVGILGGLIAPTLYMLRFGVKSAFTWVLVHLAIIVSLLLIFAAFAAPRPSYSQPYDDCPTCGRTN